MGEDSAYSVDKTSHNLTWREKETRRRDEKTSQHNEVTQAMTKADVMIQSNTLEEQGEISVESSRVPLDIGNASAPSPMTR